MQNASLLVNRVLFMIWYSLVKLVTKFTCPQTQINWKGQSKI